MSLPVRTVQRGTAGVVTGREPGTVELTGIMREAEVASWLAPLFEELHRSAVMSAMRMVVLDLRKLEYANAAVWTCLVRWVKLLREDPESRYTLRVLSEPTFKWQQVGMSALRVFGADRLIVE